MADALSSVKAHEFLVLCERLASAPPLAVSLRMGAEELGHHRPGLKDFGSQS